MVLTQYHIVLLPPFFILKSLHWTVHSPIQSRENSHWHQSNN